MWRSPDNFKQQSQNTLWKMEDLTMATNDKKKYQLDIDSQPKDKNGNPYADPSSVAEDERP